MPKIMASPDFDPDRDLPSLEGKVILVTGGTTGLGGSSIEHRAKHSPSHVFFTGRNVSAANELISSVGKTSPTVRITFIEIDMASLASVKAAGAKFLSSSPNRLDILMCNAGIMAKPPGLSEDRFEIQFGVNFLAHAMLIRELLPVLQKTASDPTADVRIIQLTSLAYRGHPRGGFSFDTIRTVQDSYPGATWVRYG